MIHYKLPKTLRDDIYKVISASKLANFSFSEIFQLLQTIEKLEEIKEPEVKKPEEK